MPPVVNGKNCLLGKGKIYLDLLDSTNNWARTGEIFLGNCTALEATPSADELTMKSSADAAGSVIASAITGAGLGIKITGTEFSPQNVAFALFGETDLLEETGATVSTPEAFDSVTQGRSYKLAHRNVSTVEVTDGDTTTYEVDDDYTVDAITGTVYIVVGGAITTASDIEVTYVYATSSYEIARGIIQASTKAFLRFVGDPPSGPILEAEFWCVNIRGDGPIGLISDSWGNWSLTGTVESDATNHPDEPHYRIIKRGEA